MIIIRRMIIIISIITISALGSTGGSEASARRMSCNHSIAISVISRITTV